jgi:hypothetical protein
LPLRIIAVGRSGETLGHSPAPFAETRATRPPTSPTKCGEELKEAGVIEQLYVKADRSGAVMVLATEAGPRPSGNWRRCRWLSVA